jgi:hypothetical protein
MWANQEMTLHYQPPTQVDSTTQTGSNPLPLPATRPATLSKPAATDRWAAAANLSTDSRATS